MKEIIPKIDTDVLLKELNNGRFVKNTNFGKNELYIVNSNNSPNVMREIGRLREVTFRNASGGTGKEMDIDAFDMGENPFEQLLVWNPEDQEIVGGYRFIHCKNLQINDDGTVKTPTSKLFNYSEEFIRDYLPITIELGRSFVQPEYQPLKSIRKGMYSLDNLWDGLGAITLDNPDVKYLFGKITMYKSSDLLAREAIMYFLEKHFPDPDKLVFPHEAVQLETDKRVFEEIFTGKTYIENYKNLQQFVRSRNEAIPPLVNAYMNLSSTMKTFGTSVNKSFGEVEESGIMITIADIYPEKRDRHLYYTRK
jgi:hypothetical protein